MRLFEEEISASIATDGPCEVLGVEERSEPVFASNGFETHRLRTRHFGVVIYRAKTRMYPVPSKVDGQWVLPPSATETRLVIAKPSLHGTELPSSAGRYLGSFRQDGGEYWYAFLQQSVREPRRPEGSEAPKAAGAPAPAKGEGSNPAAPGKAPPERQQQASQPSTHRNSGQHGRQ